MTNKELEQVLLKARTHLLTLYAEEEDLQKSKELLKVYQDILRAWAYVSTENELNY